MVAAGGESSNVHCIECVLQTHVSNGVNMTLTFFCVSFSFGAFRPSTVTNN